MPDDQLDAAIPLIEQLMASAPWVPVEGAVDLLSSLAGAGYRLAVVSNAFGTMQRQLEELRVCSVTGEGMPQVGAVIDSRVVGVEKPDPRIFHLALEALGVEASRSVYIGDTVKVRRARRPRAPASTRSTLTPSTCVTAITAMSRPMTSWQPGSFAARPPPFTLGRGLVRGTPPSLCWRLHRRHGAVTTAAAQGIGPRDGAEKEKWC